jgi:2'-5' RNA ligase
MSSSGELVRSFLALEIPLAQRRMLGDEQQRLRSRLPPARWVRPEGLHLTVKFLGEVERERLLALAAELRPAVAGTGPVRVTFAGAGFFPNPRRPRVAWVGGSADPIGSLVEEVERVTSHHGVERERRPWSLHLTVARLRDPWRERDVQSFLTWGDGLTLEPFTCGEVVLFASSLEPGGAVYTALDRMPLT